jgi:hypothetical protein
MTTQANSWRNHSKGIGIFDCYAKDRVRCRTNDLKDAGCCASTTHLDLLRPAEFKSCARTDCGIPFPRLARHNQIYCSPERAHVVAQRALRKRQKEEEIHL